MRAFDPSKRRVFDHLLRASPLPPPPPPQALSRAASAARAARSAIRLRLRESSPSAGRTDHEARLARSERAFSSLAPRVRCRRILPPAGSFPLGMLAAKGAAARRPRSGRSRRRPASGSWSGGRGCRAEADQHQGYVGDEAVGSAANGGSEVRHGRLIIIARMADESARARLRSRSPRSATWPTSPPRWSPSSPSGWASRSWSRARRGSARPSWRRRSRAPPAAR